MRSSSPCTSSVTACRRSRTAASSRRTRCSSSLRLARCASARPRATRASRHGGVDRGERGGQRVGDARGGRELGATHDGAARGIGCGLLLGVELPFHGPHAGLLGAHALLRGLESQPGLDLGLACLLERGERAVAGGRVEHRPFDRPGVLERGLRLVGGPFGVADALLGVRGRLLEAGRLRLDGLGLHACPVQLLRALRELASKSRSAASACFACSFERSRIGALLGEVEAGRARSRRAGPRAGHRHGRARRRARSGSARDPVRRARRSGRRRCRPS